MDWDHFWAVIAAGYRPNDLDHHAALKAELGGLPWFAVVAFQARLEEAIAAAGTADLWAAADLIQGGCGDDAFTDFRAWLVGRGQAVYDAALLDPDSLADVLDGDPVDGFGLDGLAEGVYEAKTGMSDFREQVDRARTGPADDPPAPELDPAEQRRRFPRLAALYLADDRERPA